MWILLTVLRRVTVRLLRYLRRGIFLVPVAAMAPALFGVRPWTIAVVLLGVILAFWRPVIAAALLPLSMVVAGISGLVVAATQSGSGFWAVTTFVGIKRRLVRRPPVVVKRAIAGRVKVVRVGPAGGPNRVIQVAPGTQVHVNPGQIAKAVTTGRPGMKFPVPAPTAFTWQKVPGGAASFHATSSGGFGSGSGLWLGGLLVPLALLLLTLGLWLLPRSAGTLRTHAAGLLTSLRQRMLENRWGILLIPVALLGLTVFGLHLWTVAAVLVCMVTVVQWPVIAADLVPLALAAFAARGFMIAASWPGLPAGLERPGLLYGGIMVGSAQSAMLAGAEASAFLVVAAWLVPADHRSARPRGAGARAGRGTRGPRATADRDPRPGRGRRRHRTAPDRAGPARRRPGPPGSAGDEPARGGADAARPPGGRAGPGRRGPGNVAARAERPA
ncbi:MAG: hypothetical protein ACR2MP_32390 [Streptosporangiaceae bacterium]